MSTVLIKVVQVILALSFLILVHELGHFTFAKLFKTRVNKFYLFFNPKFSIVKCKKINGKLKFSCETEDVEFVYDIKSTYSVHGVVGSEVLPVCKCTVTVYATKQDYYNSDVATMEFTLDSNGEVCDVNGDGVVNVADIATIIDKMAGK